MIINQMDSPQFATSTTYMERLTKLIIMPVQMQV